MATSAPPTSAPQKSEKWRNVVFTVNNYSKEDWLKICSYSGQNEGISYIIVAHEVGEEGTRHLQGYAEFSNSRSTGVAFSNFIKLFGKGHFEKRMGTAQQASDYCEFSDYPENLIRNDPLHKAGEISRQGERTDWLKAAREISKDKVDVVKVILNQPQLLPAIRALERFQQLNITPVERTVQVVLLLGSPGSGKSRYVWENHPNAYSKPSGPWWDGYLGETTILLDDYYGDIEYSEFLKVLDRYKYRVPVKGGFVGARWTHVYITSNKPPSAWYPGRKLEALHRRINETRHLDEPKYIISDIV